MKSDTVDIALSELAETGLRPKRLLKTRLNQASGMKAGGGSKNAKVTVALPQRKGNDSGGRAQGRRQL